MHRLAGNRSTAMRQLSSGGMKDIELIIISSRPIKKRLASVIMSTASRDTANRQRGTDRRAGRRGRSGHTHARRGEKTSAAAPRSDRNRALSVGYQWPIGDNAGATIAVTVVTIVGAATTRRQRLSAIRIVRLYAYFDWLRQRRRFRLSCLLLMLLWLLLTCYLTILSRDYST